MGIPLIPKKHRLHYQLRYIIILPDKCTECVGFHDELQCAAVCAVDCCVDEPDHRETKEELLNKKEFMHLV